MSVSSLRGSSSQGWVWKLRPGLETVPQTGGAGLKGLEEPGRALTLIKLSLPASMGRGIDLGLWDWSSLGPQLPSSQVLGPRSLKAFLERVFSLPGLVELRRRGALSSRTDSGEPRAEGMVHLPCSSPKGLCSLS